MWDKKLRGRPRPPFSEKKNKIVHQADLLEDPSTMIRMAVGMEMVVTVVMVKMVIVKMKMMMVMVMVKMVMVVVRSQLGGKAKGIEIRTV